MAESNRPLALASIDVVYVRGGASPQSSDDAEFIIGIARFSNVYFLKADLRVGEGRSRVEVTVMSRLDEHMTESLDALSDKQLISTVKSGEVIPLIYDAAASAARQVIAMTNTRIAIRDATQDAEVRVLQRSDDETEHEVYD
ncbi:MAG: hypothetical protein L0G99_17000 [Propionibacteriales bacterium]|nr:hypothetical protein [Propionibacteriales bacterium]